MKVNKRIAYSLTSASIILNLSLSQVAVGQSEKIMAAVKQIYPVSKITVEKTIEGTLTSIDIAKGTGEFVLSTKDRNEEGHVYLFNSSGNMEWELHHLSDSKIHKLRHVITKISKNGRGILVNWQGDNESTHIQFYDRSKNLVFERLWSHGPLESISDDGFFLFFDRIIKYDGTVRKIQWPNLLEIPPFPNKYLISGNLIAVDGVVRTDTIRSSEISAKTKTRIAGRKPPGGILKREHTTVFLLMNVTGTIIKEINLGINGAAVAHSVDGDIVVETKMLSKSKGRDYDYMLALLNSKGTVIWERSHPLNHIGDISWFGDAKYLYAKPSYSARFVILKREDGQTLELVEFDGLKRLGSIIDIFRKDNKLYVNRRAIPLDGKKQFSVRIFDLNNRGRINKYYDLDGLVLDLPQIKTLLQYESDSEAYQQRRGLYSRNFTIRMIKKEE